MRITNKMITNSYSRSLNHLFSDMNKLSNQVVSQRKFAKSSEDTAAAVSAYQIRRNLSHAEDYKENILTAQDFLTNSETILDKVNESLQNAILKVQTAVQSATISKDERSVFAEELKAVRDQILQTLNSNSTGMYIFGGSNTVENPFTVDSDGNLAYNAAYTGGTLKSMSDADASALSKDGLTIDIGMGLTVTAGNIDSSSVFTYSITGIEIMPAGYTNVNGEDVSNNVYDQLTRIVQELEKDDGTFSNDMLEGLFGKLQKSSGDILHNITKIGAKTSYLGFMEDRYDTQILSLQERQNHVEVADPALTLVNFQTQKVAYQTALQMGADMIQPSIFNFMD